MSRRCENIYKRKDNRFEGRYIKGYDLSGKAKFGYVYGKTYKETKEKLIAFKANPQKQITNSRKPIGAFCDEWLILKRSRVKESTYVKYYTTINNHLKPAFGKYLPQNLSTVVIEEYSYELLTGDEPLSPKTVKDILIVLSSVIKYIKKSSGLNLQDIEIVYPKEKQNEMRVLTKEEQQRFVNFLLSDMDSVKFSILFALLTGLRIGEVCALKWSDISLEHRCVTVRETMQRLQIVGKETDEKTHIVVGDAKSDASVRMIPLNNTAYRLCERMIVSNKDAYILTGTAHKYLEPRALQYRLGKYTDACGLEGVHFHTLRHTFATRCVEVGFEIKSLSEILGHSSVTITLNRYVHSSFELKRTNMEKLEVIGL